MKKGKLRIENDEFVAFYCKGCKEYHGIRIQGDKSYKWDFNGDYNKPTFTPSILVKSGHYVDGDKNHGCWCNYEERFGKPAPYKCYICHSFVTDGKIQYLSDCTHELAGQTIELEDEE